MASFIIENQSYSPGRFCESFLESPTTELRDIATWVKEWMGTATSLTLQTSGSTGVPSTIKLPRSAFVASAKLTAHTFELPQGTNALLCLPSTYVAGKMMVIRALVNDWNIYWVPPTSTVKLPANIAIDFAAMTPMQVEKSLAKNWPQMKKLIIGGAALKPSLHEALQQVNTKCFETYGMTETLTHVAVRSINGETATAAFVPLDGIECSLDSRGCLNIMAPHISPSTIVTNDIAQLFIDGSFSIVGRVDHVINSGGIKLFPEKIESLIAHLIQVPFYVKGESDNVLGKKAVLVIEDEPWTSQKTKAMFDSLRSSLSSVQVPKAIYFRIPLDRTRSGKIIRS